MKKKKKKNKKKTSPAAVELSEAAANAPEVSNGNHAVKDSPADDDEEEVEAGGDGKPLLVNCKNIIRAMIYCHVGSLITFVDR